jgi:DNA repair photolyase
MEIIYEPRGKAKEYAPLAVNLYKGCDHGCTYCFGPATLKIKRENFHVSTKPKKDALQRLSRDAEKLRIAGDDREILLSFVTDPYQTIETETMLTQDAINILKQNNLRFTILTKGGLRAVRDFDLLAGYDKASFGSTLIFTKQEDAYKWEPHAPTIATRIEAIKEAHNRGIRTWVSLEPVICPDQALELIEKLHPIVNSWKVGKLNYMRLDVDWLKFRNDVIALLDSLRADYYLKKSLRDIDQPREKQKRKIVATVQSTQKITSSREASLKPWSEGDISVRQGKRNILVIAPHGHPSDDTGTYELARLIADQLDCYAVVNQKYRKPGNLKAGESYDVAYQVDLNLWANVDNSPQAKTHFLGPIDNFKNEILKNHQSPLILHIHGIENENLEKVAELLPKYKGRAGDLNFLIGYGQRKGDSSRLTADFDKVITPLLSPERGLKGDLAPVDPIFDQNGIERWYCGNDPKRLNQVLCIPKGKVQSLQLEFRKSGLRDSEDGRAEASKNISEALIEVWGAVISELEAEDLIPVHKSGAEAAFDEKLVSRTYKYLRGVVRRHFHRAMLEAGTHIIKKFFDGDFNRAKNPRNATKIHSLNELIRRLQGNNGDGPSKTWVYNAVKLAVDEDQFNGFSVYGKLGHSHKVYLTHVKNLEAKRELVLEAVENNYTVAKTRERIAEVQGHDPHEKFSLDSVPTDADLEKAGRDDLIRLRKEALSKFEFHKDKMAHYQGCLDAINKALKTIASKRGTPIGNVIELGSREATEPEQQHQKREQGII